MDHHDHLPEITPVVDEVCAMCGAGALDAWETEPGRIVELAIGSRFWDIPMNAVSPEDLCVLCDECHEGVESLRTFGAVRT